jgi:hypothetical protein
MRQAQRAFINQYQIHIRSLSTAGCRTSRPVEAEFWLAWPFLQTSRVSLSRGRRQPQEAGWRALPDGKTL